jgi:hypothetical protein
MSFVDDFLVFTESAESPTSYFKWAAYTLIGAVLRDHVYIRLSALNTIYPNLYTIILSKGSSATRKGTPLKAALALLREVDNTHIIAGKGSMPGIFKVLQNAHTNVRGETYKGASGLLYSEEMTAFFVEEPNAIDVLTEWYDFHKKWDSSLSKDGSQFLENVCISLLMATNEANVQNKMDERTIKGGFLARTLIIAEEKFRKLNSLEYEDDKPLPSDKHLIDQLLKMSKLRGNFTRTTEAKYLFHNWYMSFAGSTQISDTGIEARIHTTIRKLSMILSVNESDSKVIEGKHVEQAIDECLSVANNYKRLTAGAGVSYIGKQGAIVLKFLLGKAGFKSTRREILNKLWTDVDVEVLDKILSTYNEGGIVELTQAANGKDIEIELTQKTIDLYNEKLIRKQAQQV